MSQVFNTDFDAGFDSGEADYFSAILALQNDAKHKSTLPQALLDEVASIDAALKSEAVDWAWPKPVLLNAGELVALGLTDKIIVFRRQTESVQTIFAMEQSAIIALAALLLGGKPTLFKREASPIERQIAAQFIPVINADFMPVDTPESSLIWQDFVGAKLPFDDALDSAFMVVMINRRNETVSTLQSIAPNVQQQNYLKQALGQGLLNVDYVLDGGQVALAMLRSLEVGSVLPLASLNDQPLEARANGKVVFSGVLNLSPDCIRFDVTRTLAEASR